MPMTFGLVETWLGSGTDPVKVSDGKDGAAGVGDGAVVGAKPGVTEAAGVLVDATPVPMTTSDRPYSPVLDQYVPILAAATRV